MGCWNQTCGMSHLPIRAGEKVRAFILVPNWFNMQGRGFEQEFPFKGNGECYSTDVYRPMSWAFKAEYNDYGGVENIEEDANTEAMFNYINRLLKEGKFKITKEYGEKADTVKIKDFNIMCNDFIERGRTPFGIMLVLESVYNAAVVAVEENRDKTYDAESKVDNYHKDLELARAFLLKPKTSIDGMIKKAKTKKEKELLIKLKKAEMFTVWPTRPEAKFGRNVAEYFAGIGYAGGGLIDDYFAIDNFKPLLKDSSTDIKDLVDHVQFSTAMTIGRRPWIAQVGQGSQCEEYKFHRLLGQAVLAHIEGRRQEWLKDIDPDNQEEVDYCNKHF